MPGSARRSIPARPEVGKSDTVVNFCPALGTRARPVSHPESLFKVNYAQAAICGKTEECDRTLNSHRRDDRRLWPEWRLSSSHRLPMPPVFGKFRPMGCRPRDLDSERYADDKPATGSLRRRDRQERTDSGRHARTGAVFAWQRRFLSQPPPYGPGPRPIKGSWSSRRSMTPTT